MAKHLAHAQKLFSADFKQMRPVLRPVLRQCYFASTFPRPLTTSLGQTLFHEIQLWQIWSVGLRITSNGTGWSVTKTVKSFHHAWKSCNLWEGHIVLFVEWK